MSITYSTEEKEQVLIEKPQNELIEDLIIDILKANTDLNVIPYPEDIAEYSLSSDAEILVFIASKQYKKKNGVMTAVDHYGEITLYSKYRRSENINSINNLSNYIEKFLHNVQLENIGLVTLSYSEPEGYDGELQAYIWKVKLVVNDVLIKGIR